MIWIQVRDVHAGHVRLAAAGVPIVRDPVAEPWGLIEMQIEDPDGIRIVLVEVPADHPVRRDPRSALPPGRRTACRITTASPKRAPVQRPPDTRQIRTLADRWHLCSCAQIIQFGATPDDHCANQVAEHIGGSPREVKPASGD
jgi:hypothetical protein